MPTDGICSSRGHRLLGSVHGTNFEISRSAVTDVSLEAMIVQSLIMSFWIV
jgi:hypothetical protein